MVEIIFQPRQAGKTTQLVKMSAETGCRIVCSENSIKHIKMLAKEMGVSIPNPMPYQVFVGETYFSDRQPGVLIDDADLLLSYISNVPIRAITLTDPRTPPEQAEDFDWDL